jgi:hypothetical protein
MGVPGPVRQRYSFCSWVIMSALSEARLQFNASRPTY